jgi:hypothetical protein
MQEFTLSQFVERWLLDHPEHSDLDLFNFGRSFADPSDIFQNIMSWNNSDEVDRLVFKLIKARKVSVSSIIESYAQSLMEINKEKSETINELSVNLLTFRHKMYTTKDIEECNERADKILKVAGWERKNTNQK